MLTKIKQLIKEHRSQQQQLISLARENEWAHVFHDSIKGKPWLENQPLNVGRWAGNYSFFYILNRILSECKPKKILDLGLGESSKFIHAYLNNYLPDSIHHIVEHDLEWSEAFSKNYPLPQNSKIIVCPLHTRLINGFEVNSYQNFSTQITEKYNLYIIDGPFGSPRYSRYEIVNLIETLTADDEFIILFDDVNRIGEQDTVNTLRNQFIKLNIPVYEGLYEAGKNQWIFASAGYKFVCTL